MKYKRCYSNALIVLFLSHILIECKEVEKIIPPGIISSISPSAGQPGEIVKVRGNNFSKNPSENRVTFNKVNAEIITAYDTLLEVRVPTDGTSGLVELSVRNETAIGPLFKVYSVYCYGENYYFAGYWKDGVATKLSSRGYIYDLAISGQDVHAIGYESLPDFVPKYWKNGESVALEGLTPQMKLTGIAVSGQDVYICGTKNGPFPVYSTAQYWKNGKLIFSTNPYDYATAKAFDIQVNRNDVYMVGSEYPNAMLWKNGTATQLSDGKSIHEARRVRIVGSDVHIIGSQILPSTGAIQYWKNGSMTTIKEGLAMDFAISGLDTYICGYDYKYQENISNKTVAKYWKNGIENTLSTGVTNRYGAAIEVTEDAIFVLSNEYGSIYPYYSILTKNGKDITPDFGPGVTGSINGILIVYY